MPIPIRQLLPARPEDKWRHLLRFAMAAFIAAIVVSLAGTLLLKLFPSLMGVFGSIYPTLVKAPTWAYMTLLGAIPILMYAPSLGLRKILLFAAWGSAIGGASELIGTSTGFPFGEYLYTVWLGPKILGHVPYFIPLSWFAMSVISLDMAYRITSVRIWRILAASFFMVLWDVSLDPAMSRAFPFWIYPGGGFYYGMPWTNWVGWFVVSLVIAAGYEYLFGGLRRPDSWAPAVYLLNCLFPLLMCLLYGLYGAVLFGALATALPFVLARRSFPMQRAWHAA